MWRERFAMVLGAVLAGLSWLLIATGGLMFWCGDRALREFAHMSWGLAELLGIGGGVVLMILGGALRTVRDS